MTEIDFYIASSNAADSAAVTDTGREAHLIACRLAEKAYRRGLRVYVHTGCSDSASAFDTMLWDFRPNAFVPHALTESPEARLAEVLIGCDGETPGGHEASMERREVLINLSGERPSFFPSYQRLAEIVAADEPSKIASRERYRYYKDRGYPLKVHNL